MAVKLRLTRVGSKKNPIYRVVAADSRAPRDGKFLEIVGRYNPQTDPSTIDLDAAKRFYGDILGMKLGMEIPAKDCFSVSTTTITTWRSLRLVTAPNRPARITRASRISRW